MSTLSPSSSGSKRYLWIALVVAVGLFAVSVPWQKRQWEESARLRAQTETQEKQIAELQNAKNLPSATSASPLQHAGQQLSSGDISGAEQTLTEAEQHLRADAPAEAALGLSDLFQKVGRIDRAYYWAKVAQQKAPQSLETLLRIGYLELLIGHAAPAQRAFQEALKRYPKRAEPHVAFALYLNQTEDGDTAAQHLRRALELQPDNWQVRLLLAQQLVKRQQTDAALQTLEPLRQEPQAAQSYWLQLADIYLDRARRGGKPAEEATKAEQALMMAAKLPDAPRPTEILSRQGRVCLLRDDKTGARAAFEKLLALNPEQSGIKYELGRLRLQTGDRARGEALLKAQEAEKKSTQEYERLVLSAGAEPQTAAAHRALAKWCEAHGKTARARLEWEFVRTLAPGDAQVEVALARLNGAAR